MPACTTQPCPTSADPKARHTAMPRAISACACSSGAVFVTSPARPIRPAQHLRRAEDAKPLLAEHADHRLQQPVVTGESGTADPRQ